MEPMSSHHINEGIQSANRLLEAVQEQTISHSLNLPHKENTLEKAKTDMSPSTTSDYKNLPQIPSSELAKYSDKIDRTMVKIHINIDFDEDDQGDTTIVSWPKLVQKCVEKQQKHPTDQEKEVHKSTSEIRYNDGNDLTDTSDSDEEMKEGDNEGHASNEMNENSLCSSQSSSDSNENIEQPNKSLPKYKGKEKSKRSTLSANNVDISDEYEMSDPFIDDTEALNNMAVRPKIPGFFIWKGPVESIPLTEEEWKKEQMTFNVNSIFDTQRSSKKDQTILDGSANMKKKKKSNAILNTPNVLKNSNETPARIEINAINAQTKSTSRLSPQLPIRPTTPNNYTAIHSVTSSLADFKFPQRTSIGPNKNKKFTNLIQQTPLDISVSPLSPSTGQSIKPVKKISLRPLDPTVQQIMTQMAAEAKKYTLKADLPIPEQLLSFIMEAAGKAIQCGQLGQNFYYHFKKYLPYPALVIKQVIANEFDKIELGKKYRELAYLVADKFPEQKAIYEQQYNTWRAEEPELARRIDLGEISASDIIDEKVIKKEEAKQTLTPNKDSPTPKIVGKKIPLKKFRFNNVFKKLFYEIQSLEIQLQSQSPSFSNILNHASSTSSALESKLIHNEMSLRKNVNMKILQYFPEGWVTTRDISTANSIYKKQVKDQESVDQTTEPQDDKGQSKQVERSLNTTPSNPILVKKRQRENSNNLLASKKLIANDPISKMAKTNIDLTTEDENVNELQYGSSLL